MKTFKIQPRCAVDADCLQTSTSHRGRKEGEGNLPTPTNEKVARTEHQEGLGSTPLTLAAKELSKTQKWKNRSLIETSQGEPLARIRMAASDWVGYLDNQIFSLRTEGESQQAQLVQLFDEMCTRLARKHKSLQAYIDQQVEGLASKLLYYKEKLEGALDELDSMASKPGFASMTGYELETYLGINQIVCPEKVILPTLVDPQEMLSTFTELVDGHICKKEFGIDSVTWSAFAARLRPNIFGGLMNKKDDPSIASSSILKVNNTSSILSAKQLLTSESQGLHLESNWSPPANMLTHKHTNSEAQGTRFEKKASKPTESAKGALKQKSYDANSHRSTNPQTQSHLKEISKLAGPLPLPNPQPLNFPLSQQHKSYFSQPFINKTNPAFNNTVNIGSFRQQCSTVDGDAYGSVLEAGGRHSTNWLRGKVGQHITGKRTGAPALHSATMNSPMQNVQPNAQQLNISMTSRENQTATLPASRATSVKRPVSSMIEHVRTHQTPISKQTQQDPSSDAKRSFSNDHPHVALQNHFHKKFRSPQELENFGLKQPKPKEGSIERIEKMGLLTVTSVLHPSENFSGKHATPLSKTSFLSPSSESILQSRWDNHLATKSLMSTLADKISHEGIRYLSNENDALAANRPHGGSHDRKSAGRKDPTKSEFLGPKLHINSRAEEKAEKAAVDLECHENMEIILPRPITHIEEADDDCED